MRARTLLLMVVCAIGAPWTAQAVPRVLGYEGRLIQDGNPATGTIEVTFGIYAAGEQGAALWSERQTLALTDGFHATYLGSFAYVVVRW